MERTGAISIVLVLVLVGVAAYAATPYTPLWAERVTVANIPLEVVTGVSGDPWGGNGVYASGIFYYDTGTANTTNATIAWYASNGTQLDYIIVQYGPGNVSFEGLAVGPNYVYAAGYVETSTILLATVVGTNKSDLGASFFYNFSGLSPSSYATIYYGVCTGGDGSVYTTGYAYNGSYYHIVVARFSETLERLGEVTLVSTTGNLTGYSCVIGPDGYLYVAGHILWWSGTRFYPIYAIVVKLDPYTLDVLGTATIRLYNSQYYVNGLTLVPVGIASTGQYLALAATYTDELPDPTNPTSGGFVALLDTGLNVVSRRNYTTSYYERLVAVATGGSGEVIAVGSTNNDYATGLGTSYFHGILLILDSSLQLTKAILSGNDSYGEVLWSTGVGSDGLVYSGGYDGSDNTVFYDVTTDVTLQSLRVSKISKKLGVPGKAQLGPQGVEADVAKIPSPPARITISYDYVEPAGKPVQEQLSIVERPIGVLVTPSGGSSGLLVAYNERVTPPSPPPVPVPEPWEIALVAIAVVAIILYYRGRAVHSSQSRGT